MAARLEGVDLARTIAQRPLPATIAVEYAMQAMIALAEAHAAGIVHRDLKPGNLFVTRRPDGGPLVKVLDFGVAKALDGGDYRLTRTRAMLGSPGYMSPEQLESARDVDARSDIWSLGVTLYQLLSGRLPFSARTATEIAVKLVTESPEPLDVDPRLRAVVLRCLEKAVDSRYQDVAALAGDLVPFGGPQARRIAATVARVARQPVGMSTPQGVPAVPLHAPTAASVAASATGSMAVSGPHAPVVASGPYAPVAVSATAPPGPRRRM
ncbi:MAG TPA: serine/threonine-protein kinase, partial [Kofleriaceae bacterium]